MRIIGIDPGLNRTGWGVIEAQGNRLSFIAVGVIRPSASLPLYARLAEIDAGLEKAITLWKPEFSAIEETFVNKNAASALKLGQARGAAILSLARTGLEVSEYASTLVKKSLTGNGHADKDQVAAMIRVLLPKSGQVSADESDALAVAVCHAHHAQYQSKMDQSKVKLS